MYALLLCDDQTFSHYFFLSPNRQIHFSIDLYSAFDMSTDIPLNNSLSSSVYGTVLASTSSVPACGIVAPTPLLGVGGLPMATPHFHSLVLETLRHSSSGWQQGPN
ncbi:Hypothetical protein, putative, partial [Bodo saltans]